MKKRGKVEKMNRIRKLEFFVLTALVIVLVFAVLVSVSDHLVTTGKVVDGIDSGLVAYWNFDSRTNYKDNSGNSNTLSDLGTDYTTGVVNGARKFDGRDAMRASSSKALRITEGLTLSAWIFPTDINRYETIIWKGDSSNANYYLTLDGSTLVFGTVDSGDIIELRNGDAENVEEFKWHHVVATFDGNSNDGRLFVNNVIVHSENLERGLKDVSGELSIGRRSGYNDRNYIGRIDDVRIYNRVLTNSEINSLYDFGNLEVKDSDEGGDIDEDEKCVEDWDCEIWGECERGYKSRVCEDLNDCGTTKDKPEDKISCEDKDKGDRNLNLKDSVEIIYFLIGIIIILVVVIFIQHSRSMRKSTVKVKN
jgi:predicted nucleic acid-binding Zn ribbon protein